MTEQDQHFMALAIEQALTAEVHCVSPNPRVGCVLVLDGKVVAKAAHHQLGGPHAEINALNQCRERGLNIKGATAYITLEPCSHTGRTGPCVDALISAQVARVVFAMVDPNPVVAGSGLEKLRLAGVSVIGPCLEARARELNPGFIKRMETGLPRVLAKVAMSLDGKSAMASGESQWITGPTARIDVHKLRLSHGAIITGIDTVLTDDCQLTVRLPEVDSEQGPLRVVLDTHARLPVRVKLWQSGAPVLWCMASDQLNSSKVGELQARYSQLKVLGLPECSAGGLSIEPLLQWLAGEGQCNEVMIEAGSRLTGAMIHQGWVDELVIYQASLLLGDRALSAFKLPFDQLSQALSLKLVEHVSVGCDQRLRFSLVSG